MPETKNFNLESVKVNSSRNVCHPSMHVSQAPADIILPKTIPSHPSLIELHTILEKRRLLVQQNKSSEEEKASGSPSSATAQYSSVKSVNTGVSRRADHCSTSSPQIQAYTTRLPPPSHPSAPFSQSLKTGIRFLSQASAPNLEEQACIKQKNSMDSKDKIDFSESDALRSFRK